MAERGQQAADGLRPLRIAWVQRTFLDYRLPVLAALDQQNGAVAGARGLHFLFSADAVPDRCTAKAQALLGPRAVGLRGEWGAGREDREFRANRNFSVRWQPGLLRELRRIAPDVVIGNGFFKWTVAGYYWRATRGVPLVVTYERTAHTERHAQWYRRSYRRWCLRHIDALCANGSLCRDYLVGHGVPETRITLGHMVADTEGLAARVAALTRAEVDRVRRDLGLGRLTVGCVGRLLPLKGLEEALRGWQAAGLDAAGATLLLVGDGPERQRLVRLAAELGIRGVRFAGAVDYDRLAPYYACLDALLMPSLEDNWSLVVPEAMACGKPVLCSTRNGCWPELVRHGETGWLFDPADLASLSHALRQCVDHRDQLPAMGARSRTLVATHSPAAAAASVLSACRIAIDHRRLRLARRPAAPPRERRA
ncbi:MAG: glycosyltransferase family 4 protein [Planctomycetota bacterium]